MKKGNEDSSSKYPPTDEKTNSRASSIVSGKSDFEEESDAKGL